MSEANVIVLRLDREQAEGYLRLLESRPRDVGFMADAHWLREQMKRRGWVEVTDDE
jgi:hypothetical protein